MLKATVKKDDEVVASITAPTQALLDRVLAPYPANEYDIEIEGEADE